MAEDLEPLRAQVRGVARSYYNKLNTISDFLVNGAIKLATLNVTEVRINQTDFDIDEIKSALNKNPSFGIFLSEAVLSLLPIIGGHIIQSAVNGILKQSIISRVMVKDAAEQISKLPQVVKLKSLKDKHLHLLTEEASDNLKAGVEAKIKSYSSFFTTLDYTTLPSNKIFEFATPLSNDVFQKWGEKLLIATEHKDLIKFKNASKSPSVSIEEYYQGYDKTYKPTALLTAISDDMLIRQKEINETLYNLLCFNFNISSTKGLLELYEEEFKTWENELPKGIQLTKLRDKYSKVYEACIWLLILGDPSQWISSYDASTDQYWWKGANQMHHFYLERSLPSVIEDHLITRFHPIDSSENFLDHYTNQKKLALNKDTGHGIDGNGYHRQGSGYEPDFPAYKVESTDYTAKETAIANMCIWFNGIYIKSKNDKSYFIDIICSHIIM